MELLLACLLGMLLTGGKEVSRVSVTIILAIAI